MESTGERQPTMDELCRLVQEQQARLDAQVSRIAALEAAARGALPASVVPPADPERHLPSAGEAVLSRALLLRTAAAGAVGLAGASIINLGGPEPVLAESQRDRADILGFLGSWIVYVTYTSSSDRVRGLATFAGGSAFVGSVSGYETAPASPTPSRGTTLHGSWVPTGERSSAVTALRLHLDATGTLIGVMTTNLTAMLAPGSATWDGTFTFDAAHLDGSVYKTGAGTLHATRIAQGVMKNDQA